MTRTLTCLFAIATIASSAALAQTQSGGAAAAPARQSTLQLLNMRIPEVAFEGVPLEQVMDWIEDITGTNVVVRWQTLEENGVERDKPISIKVRNLRLAQVLWMIMNEAGGTDVKLAYRCTGNLLVLSLHEDLGKDMIVRVYDVSDLLLNVPRFTNAASLNPGQALNQASQGGGGGGGGGGAGGQLFEDDEQGQEGDQNGEDRGAEIQKLVQVITDTVEPDTWNINGGLGSITPLRGQLVIRNSILVHQLIGGYMQDEVLSR